MDSGFEVVLDAIFFVGCPVLMAVSEVFGWFGKNAFGIGIVVFLLLWCMSPILIQIMLDGWVGVRRCGKDPFEQQTLVEKITHYPVIYSPSYNITACGIEQMHPFDSTKYGRTAEMLCELLEKENLPFSVPKMLPREILMDHMTWTYRALLGYSFWQSRVFELPLFFLPGWLIRWRVLNPMRLAAGGTLAGTEIAVEGLERWKEASRPASWYGGFSINLSGGYHHATGLGGHGFCAIPDLGMAVRYAAYKRKEAGLDPIRVLIVDLDVHQGDGTARDVVRNLNNIDNVCLVDFFNPDVFPGDTHAEEMTQFPIHVLADVSSRAQLPPTACAGRDKSYLSKLASVLPSAISSSSPDLVLYNGGTDVLRGDPLGGGVSLSPEGIARRDTIVLASCGAGARLQATDEPAPENPAEQTLQTIFSDAGGRRIPVVWVLSGGYQRETASVIASSIAQANENLGLGLKTMP